MSKPYVAPEEVFPTHPGYEAGDCFLRRTVTGKRSDGCAGGYGCNATGGHCVPGEKCEQWRAEEHERLAFKSLIEEEATAFE